MKLTLELWLQAEPLLMLSAHAPGARIGPIELVGPLGEAAIAIDEIDADLKRCSEAIARVGSG